MLDHGLEVSSVRVRVQHRYRRLTPAVTDVTAAVLVLSPILPVRTMGRDVVCFMADEAVG